MSEAPDRTLLSVEDLKVSFNTEDGLLTAVEGSSFDLSGSEVLAIVGESGCGKSVTAQTLIGLTRGHNTRISGSVRYGDTDLVTAGDSELQRLRGAEIAMVFQDPMTSLNPIYRVGDQIAEQILAHRDIPKQRAKDNAVEMLARVGIPAPAERARAYPHEFSGGMLQRAMIAMALSLDPKILIADEPTTALDVTIQAQILALLRELNEELGLAVLLITHDLGVVASIADRVLVMYAGQIVEQGTLDEIFYDPTHPYTWGLLGSLTPLDADRPERLPQIQGQPPSLLNPPPGCHFSPRCPHAFDRCGQPPPLVSPDGSTPNHLDRCFLSSADKRSRRNVEGRIGLAAG